ncbi:hypothetical protein DFH29DRAFT_884076, partial [Suillus ampliporus]
MQTRSEARCQMCKAPEFDGLTRCSLASSNSTWGAAQVQPVGALHKTTPTFCAEVTKRTKQRTWRKLMTVKALILTDTTLFPYLLVFLYRTRGPLHGFNYTTSVTVPTGRIYAACAGESANAGLAQILQGALRLLWGSHFGPAQ